MDVSICLSIYLYLSIYLSIYSIYFKELLAVDRQRAGEPTGLEQPIATEDALEMEILSVTA